MKRKLVIVGFMITVSMLTCSISYGVDHYVYTTTEQCVACHVRTLPTHLLGNPAAMTDPLPIDPSGTMDCFTCHNCAGSACILRKNGAELCRNCHACICGMSCLLNKAHWGDSSNMERLSSACLDCHDGTVGHPVGGPGEHRLDVVYRVTAGFNPISDERVVLVDESISCVSCHNPYKSDTSRLSKSNAGAALCTTCHRK